MTNHRNDASTDEVRRQLRDTDSAHRLSLPSWRRALDRAFDPTNETSTEEKAALLGLPQRRAFLVGGAAVAGSAFLAACGKKKHGQTPLTGDVGTEPATTTTTAPGSRDTDETLLQTALSVELLAVDTYQKALDSDLLTTAAYVDVVKLFQSQHVDHAGALQDPIKAFNATPVTAPNQYLLDSIVDKEVSELTDETSVLVLARELENIAAQTYTEAGGVFTTSELRQASMSVGEIEARHITVLNGALGYTLVPLSFMPTRLAVSPKGYVGT